MHKSTIIAFKAATVIAAHRFVCADSSGNYTVHQATGGSEPLIGVSSAEADAGSVVEVTLDHAVPVECGADVACGDEVTADAQGRAVPAAAGNYVFGVAVTTGRAGSRADILKGTRAFER